MRQNFWFLILAVVVACGGCGAASGQTAKPRAAKMNQSAVNSLQLKKEIRFEGKFVDGAKWTDDLGDNILIVSEKRPLRAGDGAPVQRIYGYHFVTKDNQTRQLWRIEDFAANECDEGKGLVSPISVQDINGDGVAETMFVYNVQGNCDVSPEPHKLMMHSGATKLAVRGSSSVRAAGLNVDGEKVFDQAFAQAPISFKNAASEFWDKYVQDFAAK